MARLFEFVKGKINLTNLDKVHSTVTRKQYDYQLNHMSVLSQYHVQFFTKIMFGRKFCGITSDGPLMDDFINDFDSIEGANVLLDGTQQVLSGQANSITHTTDSLATAVVDIHNAKFYENPEFTSISPFFSLPTNDLKEIVIAWKNYLTQMLG